jgi:hypothetical protein
LSKPLFFSFALPDNDHAPAQFSEGSHVHPVAGGVAFKFGHPEPPVVGWGGAISATPVPMPEAAMHKHGQAVPGQNNIRAPGQFPAVQPESVAQAVKRRPDNPLRHRILPPDAAHIPTAPRFCQPIPHSQLSLPVRLPHNRLMA